MQRFSITVNEEPRGVVVCLKGNAGNDHSSEFHKAVEQFVGQQGQLLVVDMTQLKYIASMFLAELITIRNDLHSNGGEVRLAVADSVIKGVFEQTRLVELFAFFDTVDKAFDAGSVGA